MNTKKNKPAFTLLELIVLVVVLLIVFVFLFPLIPTHRHPPHTSLQCAAQLSGIGRGFAIYQNDYNDFNPTTFTPDNPGTFGMGLYNSLDSIQYPRWADPCFADWTNQPTPGSCLYLLVKYADLVPKMFLCPSAPNDQEMIFEDAVRYYADNNLPAPQSWPDPCDFHSVVRREYLYLADLNDFQSMYNLSYSYNDPWTNLATAASPPGLAILADKNPAYDTATGIPNPNFTYDPDNPESGNSLNHDGQFQNILYAGANVKREPTPLVGIDQDNIFTHWSNPNPTESQRTTGSYNQGHSAAPNDAYLGN